MQNKFLALLLCAGLLASNGSWTPACAQKNFQKFLQKIATIKQLPARISGGTWTRLNQKFLAASAAAGLAHKHTLAVASPLFIQPTTPASPRPLRPAPLFIRRAVFTLQASPSSHGKGSAFAINLDGKIWGVTARHVLDDIGRSPYMTVHTPQGKPVQFQVNSVREGNIHGADVALFEIPSQALPYLTPLLPEYDLPSLSASLQSAGFSHGNFGWFPQIQVFFASTHRILTRYQDYPIRSGYCGSPLLYNGKVIGVFTGVVTTETAQNSAWYSLVARHFASPINSFNQAVPITWVRKIANANTHPQGTRLKLWGHPIGFLYPDENIHAIQQVRNGRLFKTVPAYPFMDYNHLERFFDLKPHDIFRVVVHQGDLSSVKRRVYWYELNMDSKQVVIRE